jgi:hypothetical protein
VPRFILILITALSSLTIYAEETHTWTARTNFNVEGASYTETLTFISGISYALTASAKELIKQQKTNFFCAPENLEIGSELFVSILNAKHSGSISPEIAISTINKGLAERFPCVNTAYN